MKNILCLDFDGVICNSIDECLLVSYNGYMKYTKHDEKQINNLSELSADVVKCFLKYRYMVRPAKDYFVLIDLVLNHSGEITKEIFQEHKKKLIKQLDEFEKVFFNTRSYLQDNNSEYWLRLNPFYKEFLEVWIDLFHTYEAFVVTNKNKKAVKALLDYNDIMIEPERLFTKEDFKSKNQALQLILEKYRRKNSEIIFIDDSPETIVESLEKFPKSYLANWGYYSNRENIQSINNLKEIL